MAKNKILDFSGPTCVSYGYYIHILYVNIVLEISMMQMAILDQNKPVAYVGRSH